MKAISPIIKILLDSIGNTLIPQSIDIAWINITTEKGLFCVPNNISPCNTDFILDIISIELQQMIINNKNNIYQGVDHAMDTTGWEFLNVASFGQLKPHIQKLVYNGLVDGIKDAINLQKPMFKKIVTDSVKQYTNISYEQINKYCLKLTQYCKKHLYRRKYSIKYNFTMFGR